MAMTQDALAAELSRVIEPLGLTIHDVEIAKSLIRVTVFRSGGVALEDLTAANNVISALLDEIDPIDGRYTLEVTSPGVERRLRSEAHFAAAIGEQLSIKTMPDAGTERRIDGELIEVSADAIVVAPETGEPITLRYDQIDRARTVFQWGPTPKPSPSRAGAPKGRRRAQATAVERMTTP